nr:MAG: hypothetical protein DIU66_03980 [Bacillota bacterium]
MVKIHFPNLNKTICALASFPLDQICGGRGTRKKYKVEKVEIDITGGKNPFLPPVFRADDRKAHPFYK